MASCRGRARARRDRLLDLLGAQLRGDRADGRGHGRARRLQLPRARHRRRRGARTRAALAARGLCPRHRARGHRAARRGAGAGRDRHCGGALRACLRARLHRLRADRLVPWRQGRGASVRGARRDRRGRGVRGRRPGARVGGSLIARWRRADPRLRADSDRVRLLRLPAWNRADRCAPRQHHRRARARGRGAARRVRAR